MKLKMNPKRAIPCAWVALLCGLALSAAHAEPFLAFGSPDS